MARVLTGKPSCLLFFFCFVSGKRENTRGGSHVFTVNGFDSWKRINCGKHCAFLTHVGTGPCSSHQNAVADCQALMNQPCQIENLIAMKDKEKVERNRLRLKVSIAAVKLLTLQACAFRGHDESAQSKNKENFLEIVDLLAEFNPDIAKVVGGNAPYNLKYTAPEIQKEILSMFACKIRKHIRDEIGDSKFSILVDETCDVAKREQMALVLRFVDKGGILQERFFDLIHVENTKSMTLKAELSSVLSKHGFDIQNLRGQGYDGASNMRGDLNGLQALFLQECPYAYYVHCYAHRLQLALVDASKEVVSISQFFQKLIFIINTVDSSSKRHDKLHHAQLAELETAIANASVETGQGANQIRSLKRPGDTRWGSHFGSVYSLMEMFGVVYSMVQEIAADRSMSSLRGDADTCFSYMSSYEFIFTLCLMKEIFEITELLGQALQKKSQDIVNAIRLVSSTKECLQQLRSDDGYQEFIATVVEFCGSHSIDIPDFNEIYVMRGGRARHQPDQLTKEHYFRVEIFRATLDTQLFELDRRFNEKAMDLLSTSATLIPRNRFRGFKASDICEMVKKYYPADFTQQDIYGLQLELKHFVSVASKDEELKNISTLIGLCQRLVETGRHTIFNLIDRLFRLLITLPVSMATAELAFSSLKIIKTRLRNKMEDDYLTNSLLVNIEGEIMETYSYEDVIEDFRSAKRRRAADLYPGPCRSRSSPSLQIRKTWGRLVVGCSHQSQWHFGNWYGSPRQAVGRHRRGPAARLRPRPPPQACRPPRRRQDQRCGSGQRDRDPADDSGQRRGRADEGHAQHHDQASGRVPLVAEERGQHPAGLAARVHAAHLPVRYVPFRRRWWSLQKEILFGCIREGNTTRPVHQSPSSL